MIEKCREYLKACLNQTGIQRVHTGKSDASKHQVPPYGEITFEDSDLLRDGSLVARWDGPRENERTFRRRTYQRTEQARVKIVHRDQIAAESARDSFLNLLAHRIEDSRGNAILITAWNSEGEEGGSILRQGATSYVDVKFDGGLYADKVVKVFSTETDLQLGGEMGDITEEV